MTATTLCGLRPTASRPVRNSAFGPYGANTERLNALGAIVIQWSSNPIPSHLTVEKGMPSVANIPQLPGGVAIATTLPAGRVMPYGPHLTVSVEGPANPTAVLAKLDGTKLVVVETSGGLRVKLTELDDLSVQYANRFLEGTGRSSSRTGEPSNYRPERPARRSKANRRSRCGLAAGRSDNAHCTAEGGAAHGAQDAQPVRSSPLAVIPSSGPASPAWSSSTKVTLKGAGRGNTDVGGIIVADGPVRRRWKMRGILRQDGKPAAVLLTGPAGTAKTMLVRGIRRLPRCRAT